METIKSCLCLIRSEIQEQACVEGILSFLINEATSKEPSLALATILSNIEDACITAPIEQKTKESDKLLVFKQYVHSIYNMYISGESIPIRIYQNTWDDYKKVLSEITGIIKPTSDAGFIKNRLMMFINKIDNAINQFLIEERNAEEEYRKGRKKYGIIGAICGLAIALLSLLDDSGEFVTPFLLILSCVSFPIIGFGLGVKIYDARNNNNEE